MDFLEIDPEERDRLVKDYVDTLHQLQKQNEDEKTFGLQKREALERTFSPIIDATEKSTDIIKKHLQPIETELKTINKREQVAVKKQIWDESEKKGAMDYYSNNVSEGKLDKYFGVYKINDRYVLGNTDIEIDDESNIRVNGTTYKGTPGLWALLMLKIPSINMYDDDVEAYTLLAEQTDLRSNPARTTAKSRPYLTKKAEILKELIGDDDSQSSGKRKKIGTGVVYLPGDIKGLTTRLQLLLAEFDSGNRTSTRNEIVSILDELKRRNRISTEKYREINNHLAATL